MNSGSSMDAHDSEGAKGVTDPSIFVGRILLFMDLKEGCLCLVTRHAGSSIDYIKNISDSLKHRSKIFVLNHRVST